MHYTIYKHRLVNITYMKLDRIMICMLDLKHILEFLLSIMLINSIFMCVSFSDIVSSTDYSAVALNGMMISE